MHETTNLEWLSPDILKPYANNPRTHSDKQVDQIASSIREFEFRIPIVVDEAMEIIAGHGRHLAAQKLDLEMVPVIIAKGLSSAQKRALRLADNKIAANASWDEGLLSIELTALLEIELDFDIATIGFEVGEIDSVTAKIEDCTDATLEKALAPAPLVSHNGDIWILGKHRIGCGDCRDQEFVASLTGDVPVAMVLTDPPFNVRVDGHVCGNGKVKHPDFAMASGEMSEEEFVVFLVSWLTIAIGVSTPGALIYFFIDWRHLHEAMSAISCTGLTLLNDCVWVKANGGLGSLYRSQHEHCLVSKFGNSAHTNNVQLGKNGRYRTNVWHYAGVNSFGPGRDEALAMHPTVKPAAMLADAIMDVTNHGDTVLDPFLGSGSTLIAAERTRRHCVGIEIEPTYVDVAIRRWQIETGCDAIHQATGETFAQRALLCEGS